MSELVDLCEQVPFVMDAEGGQGKEQEDDADGRVETFRELLHFVWLGEGEGAEDLLKLKAALQRRVDEMYPVCTQLPGAETSADAVESGFMI